MSDVAAVDTLTPDRVKLFGITIDRLDLRQATDRVLGWALDDVSAGSCRYVVTPNVDHAVMYQHDARLRDAYRDAALVVADGAPLVAVSRLLGRSLPERVAGSDLAPGVIAAADAAAREGRRRVRFFLLGAPPGVADRAAFRIGQQWSGVDPVGTYCPPLGFEKDDAECERILARIADAKPDVLLVGLGAPKQELWVSRFHKRIDARVALCVGATIDFLAGEKQRSPRWMQRCGLEWAHRLASEPRRLAGRYARDAWEFPRLVWGEYRRTFQ
jgi:N-acetylglucosaminyldiphosphoundecaprenol N-acetyl-beta-D-mannosaminyltransferase